MIKKILTEVFGLTDIDPVTNLRPKNLEFTRGGVIANNNKIDPFDLDVSRINPLNLPITCTNLINNNTCSSGCNLFNVGRNQLCPIVSRHGLVNNNWGDCPCYSPMMDLLSRKQDSKVSTDIYNFSRPINLPGNLNSALTPWQYEIYDNLKSKSDNIIVSVPPGGGKTRPIKAYFYEKMLNFFNDPINNKLPRFIYFVPTKQLSIQIKNNDFIRDSEYGLHAVFSNLQNQGSLEAKRSNVQHWLINLLYNTDFKSDFEREMFVMKLVDSCVTIVSGDSSPEFTFSNDIVSKLPFLKNQIKPVIVCVKGEKLIPTIHNYARFADHIFVDEAQELLPKPNAVYNKETEDLFIQLCKAILEAKSAKVKIHLMTGSVSETTLNKLQNAFLNIFKVNFKFIPDINTTVPITDPKSKKVGEQRKLDASKSSEMPGMKNRSNITVVPLQALSGQNSFTPRVELIKTIVRTKQTNSIMVVFSARNFAKTSIINLMLTAIKDLPRVKPDSLYDNTPKINIPLTASNLNSGYHQNKVQEYTVDVAGVGFNLLDIPKQVAAREANKSIKRYSDFSSTDPKEQELLKKGQYSIPGMLPDKRDKKYVDDIEFLKYFDRYELELDGLEIDVNRMTMVKDESNLIYQSALCGIGIMIGKMHPIHKDTIQRLFQKGKIYILLATDALGVKFAPSDRNI